MQPSIWQQPIASRRGFLGAAGALLLTSQTDARAAQAAGEKTRVAVIGVGARGSDLLRSLTTIVGVEVVAIADDYAPHLEKAARYAGPQAKTYADFRQMLKDVRPQAVVIAVPLWLHFEVATAAIAAGCDVFCEKTMCYSLDEARQLVDQVTAAKRVFQVGLQRRANPIYQQAAAMVQAGILGEITSVQAQWHRNNNWRRPVPVPQTHADWAALELRLNWRLYDKTSRGLMAELGSHQMDVANWVLGTTPRRVQACGGVDYWRDGREVFDNVFCTYEYELPRRETMPDRPGASAAIAKTGVPTPPPGARQAEETYTVRVTYSSLCTNAFEGASELVLGTKGTLLLASTKGLLYRERRPDDVGWVRGASADPNAAILTAGKTLKVSNSPWAHRGEPTEIDLPDTDDTRDELVSFIDHVRRGDVATICDVHEGYRDTATVLMAHAALKNGGMVEYPG